MKYLKRLLAVLLVLALFFGIQRLFMPKYMSGVYEGAFIQEYYDDIKDNQVLFIGDCEVYENFSPMTLWEDYGITSYIRGAPNQLVWQSYYILEDTLRYETPDVVVFNVLAMEYDEPQSEAYNRLNLDGMALSPSKLRAVRASMMEEESLLSYLFPIFRYHDRWSELSSEDVQYFLRQDRTSHNGYYMRNDVKPVGIIPSGPKLADYRFGDICYEYLNKIIALCKEHDIELVLVKAPSIYPEWYPQWDEQMQTVADENDLLYLNFLHYTDEIGIDYATDTYDAGLHLNLAGAEKLSRYFGAILQEHYDLPDQRSNATLAAAWEEKSARYHAMKQQQLAELAEFGAIQTFTY